MELMTENKKKGINFTVFSTFFLFLLVVFYVILSYVSNNINAKYNSVQDIITSYIACEKSSQTIKDKSNYLTTHAELFIMTHDEKYARDYIKEKYKIKSREKAIEQLLETSSPNDENYLKLQIAMNQSQSLTSIELYGMRLAYKSAGIKNIPPEIEEIKLRPNDVKASPAEQQKIAEATIFGEGYLIYKNRVNENCIAIIQDIESKIQNKLSKNAIELDHLIISLTIIEFFVLVLSGNYFTCLITTIIIPLKNLTKSLQKKERMPEAGAQELIYLAETYNEVYEYDTLTRSLSRRAFSALCQRFEKEQNKLCLILVDVDSFKSINDKYGHSSGDSVLKEVAKRLSEVFRKNDYICRIGGDEFAVLLPDMGSEMGRSLANKIKDMNLKFSNFKTVPNVHISAGIAFSEKGYTKELFENSDKALYSAKAKGKAQASIYEN